jgi:hypothetical protein
MSRCFEATDKGQSPWFVSLRLTEPLRCSRQRLGNCKRSPSRLSSLHRPSCDTMYIKSILLVYILLVFSTLKAPDVGLRYHDHPTGLFPLFQAFQTRAPIWAKPRTTRMVSIQITGINMKHAFSIPNSSVVSLNIGKRSHYVTSSERK